ncbi:putative uncharacterized protein DDB_G0282133 [Aphis gossypii]|uniref:putative uncharacterized protein DDB_G0282133 n=1 Tax=Aphis gossypii TaxID=80765 RepID=UPI002158BF3F|nr:putative uncharacterized protein DDB_G0282133 [Aphis gossypii]
MFPGSVSARNTMILAVALIVSIAAVTSEEFANTCVFQKSTVVAEYKLDTLNNVFKETLITESNDNVYVVSICRHVPEMYYDPRKMIGAIKLTADGKTIDLGHINQSNATVNGNSVVLTYMNDRGRNSEDTCKGLRWKTHLKFLCDPYANHDILTLIDEDPEQPEICQVWFEVKTSKTCNWHSNIPLAVLAKDFSTRKNSVTKPGEWTADHEKYNARESTNSNKIPSTKNSLDHKMYNFNNNNKTFSNENDSISKENKINNEEIKNRNSTQNISTDQKKQPDNVNEDNNLNEYEKSIYEKDETEKAKEGSSKINTPENKILADHENNNNYSSNDLENKFTNLKINNTVPSTSYNNEYGYPGKNETILHYNSLKKYLNQNKNSEGKYENSVINNINESTKYDKKKDDILNQNVPEMEKISKRKTFENKTSNKEINDSVDSKKPSDNEKKFNPEYPQKSNLYNDTNNNALNLNNGIKHNIIDEGKKVDISNQSQSKNTKSIIHDDSKVPGERAKENNTNQTHSQKNDLVDFRSQEVDSKTVIKNNARDINGSIIPRDDDEKKPTDVEDKSIDTNNINTTRHSTRDDNKIIDADERNIMKNNYNITSDNDKTAFVVTIKPTKNSPSNINESGEVNGSSTELPINTSSNNIETDTKLEPNGTIISYINGVHKNIKPNQLEPVPSENLSDNSKSDDLNTNEDSANQSENNSSSKIRVSAASIIGGLVSLIAATGVIGTAINRYYYKKTGIDQIPFKETFQSIFNLFKTIITKFCCCLPCVSGVSGDDLEAQNSTNEKTPLLQPKFDTSSPVVVDETSQKSKKRNKSSDDGKQQKSDSDDSQQNSNNEYGSMKNESKPLAAKRNSKNSTTDNKSLAKNLEEKLTNAENNLQGKSIKEVISGKINSIFAEKLKPTINGIFENVGKKVESTEEIKKNLDTISKDAETISKLLENEKPVKNIEIKPENKGKSQNNSEKEPSNETEIGNAVVQENINSTKLDELQQSQNVKPINEVIIPKVSVPDLQQIETNKQASDLKTASTLDKVKTEESIENTNDKNDVVTKNKTAQLGDLVVTPISETASKINESKLKFLGFDKEDKNVQQEVANESIESEKKEEDDDDDESVEVIEEVVYIDGADGAEDEEIIEEITETTTIDPDDVDESGHAKVTVHTTRKISSSSLPGEVKTFEETVVTDGSPENEKKMPGFQFGIGKSGVSMSVGDKKLKIGMPDLKLNRSKSKSPKNVEDDEPDKRDPKSPEKVKKSMSLPKIFKRSISQPADDDIQEAESESQLDSAPIKKSSRSNSGLLKFGKSRSKSSLIPEADDVKIDTDTMSEFIDKERKASIISNIGLGEFDIAVGDADVANTTVVRKTSTTNNKEKDAPTSPTDLLLGSAKVQPSTKTTDSRSNGKTKREKKDKTKLTTITRPF